MNVGPVEAIFIFAIVAFSIAALGIPIWAIVDAAGRPESCWSAVGANKTLWIVLIAVFTFACGIVGLVLAIVYLASLRPRLRDAAASAAGMN